MDCPRPIRSVLYRFYATWSSRTRPSMRIQRSEGLGSRLPLYAMGWVQGPLYTMGWEQAREYAGLLATVIQLVQERYT